LKKVRKNPKKHMNAFPAELQKKARKPVVEAKESTGKGEGGAQSKHPPTGLSPQPIQGDGNTPKKLPPSTSQTRRKAESNYAQILDPNWNGHHWNKKCVDHRFESSPNDGENLRQHEKKVCVNRVVATRQKVFTKGEDSSPGLSKKRKGGGLRKGPDPLWLKLPRRLDVSKR